MNDEIENIKGRIKILGDPEHKPTDHKSSNAVKTSVMAAGDVTLVFTYGTLKQGFHNHVLMKELMSTRDASFIGKYTTKDSFPLVCGPHGIPFLINKPGTGYRIPGELYSVSNRGLDRLDELEGIADGHYERLPVEVINDGDESVIEEVEAYFAHRSFAEELWRRCGQVGVNEFTMELGNKYVRRSLRPLGSTFVDEVWNFIRNSDAA